MQILQTIWTALTTENEGLVNILNIPLSFIEAYISMVIFTTFFNIKSTIKTKLLYIFSFSILGYFIRILVPDPYGSFLNLIICPILIYYFFKTTILKAVVSEFIPTLIFVIVDSILLKFFHVCFNITSEEALKIVIYRLSFSIVEYFIIFLIIILIKKLNTLTISLENISKRQKIIIFTNFTFGIISIASQTYLIMYYASSLPVFIVLLSVSSLLIYFLISLFSIINTNKLNIAKQNLEETRLMNKTLTILNDKIRAFRHDFNNIIQALGGYIQAKDLDGLEKYYSQLLKDCQEVTNLSGLNQESINNPAIYSLLASKYYLATEKGIEFDLDIFMDLNSIDMKIYEFCRILGILLDNAIQATQECEEKQITVTIRKDNRCKRQLLIVENTYKEKDIDTEKIFEKGYSTKEGNTGLGLWEVRQILLKNTNLNLFTSKDDKYFKQQLEIYKS